jgi:hypothetical protein
MPVRWPHCHFMIQPQGGNWEIISNQNVYPGKRSFTADYAALKNHVTKEQLRAIPKVTWRT